jgi:hypothetical protein
VAISIDSILGLALIWLLSKTDSPLGFFDKIDMSLHRQQIPEQQACYHAETTLSVYEMAPLSFLPVPQDCSLP